MITYSLLLHTIVHLSDECHQLVNIIWKLCNPTILVLDFTIGDVKFWGNLLMLCQRNDILILLYDLELELLIQNNLVIIVIGKFLNLLKLVFDLSLLDVKSLLNFFLLFFVVVDLGHKHGNFLLKKVDHLFVQAFLVANLPV